jgi:AcrR family transcriptional regulator
MMEKIDRRVKRTNRLLQEALVALTLEKGYDTVTIRDITERADIGYATFFRHYADKDALLADVLEAMKDDFIHLLAPYTIVQDPIRTGTMIFEYVLANQDLCRVLVNSAETMALLKPIQQIGRQESTLAMMQLTGAEAEKQPGAGIPLEVGIYHLMTSLVMLIRWWLEEGMPYSPARMGEIAASMIIRPVLDAVR